MSRAPFVESQFQLASDHKYLELDQEVASRIANAVFERNQGPEWVPLPNNELWAPDTPVVVDPGAPLTSYGPRTSVVKDEYQTRYYLAPPKPFSYDSSESFDWTPSPNYEFATELQAALDTDERLNRPALKETLSYLAVPAATTATIEAALLSGGNPAAQVAVGGVGAAISLMVGVPAAVNLYRRAGLRPGSYRNWQRLRSAGNHGAKLDLPPVLLKA